MSDKKKTVSIIAQYIRDNCVKPIEKRYIEEDGVGKILRIFKDKSGEPIAFLKSCTSAINSSSLKIESLLKTNNGLIRENTITMEMAYILKGKKKDRCCIFPRTITCESRVIDFNTTKSCKNKSLFFISEGIEVAGPPTKNGLIPYYANQDFKPTRITCSSALKI